MAPGCSGPRAAPKETLRQKLEGGRVGGCRVPPPPSPAWLFCQGHLQTGLGINSPCLPLARPKPRVPLGVFQDAGHGCLQWRSDDRWRAGGEGRGQVRGADAPPQRETPSVG